MKQLRRFGLVVFGVGLLLSLPRLAADTSASPKEVLQKFWDLEIQGAWLTPEGWNQMAALLVRAKPPEKQMIAVLTGRKREYGLGDPNINGNKAEIYVDFLEIGYIDTTLRFKGRSERDTNGSLVGASMVRYTLLSDVGKGSGEWKVESFSGELHLTADAATRYVTRMRDQTNDPAIKKNADETIAILKKVKR